MPISCPKCSKAISPTFLDLVPSYAGFVAIDCPHCGQASQLPWLLSFGIELLSLVITFAVAFPIFSLVGAPAGVVAVAAVIGALLLLRLLLLLYLRLSNRPFIASAYGA